MALKTTTVELSAETISRLAKFLAVGLALLPFFVVGCPETLKTRETNTHE